MRYAGFALLSAACLPHLYSDRPTGEDTGCGWTAPTNGWPASSPPGCLAGEGYHPHQVVPDLRLDDQFGDEVSLWQFSGDLIVLNVSTVWCGPCQLLADDAEETWQKYRDRCFDYVTVLQQDRDGAPAKPEDLQDWVGHYGLTTPVLANPAAETAPAQQLIGGTLAFPGLLLIGRDLKVIDRIDGDPAEVDREIANHLGNGCR